MRAVGVFCLAIILCACASGYKDFYQPYVDRATLEAAEVRLLAPGEEPSIYGTDNFERDVRILRSKGYVPIGYSSFNGQYEDTKNAVAQAKRIGATMVLTSSEYTNTQTSTTPLFIPNTQTTYHSGSAYGYGGSATYSGTSTTHGSTVVPITSSHRRYDQEAVYLVKSTKKLRFGVSLRDLTPDQREALGRNTGALIDIVMEDHPAFYSNVMAGDFLIAIDGTKVRNAQHGSELMSAVPQNAASSEFTVIRNGNSETISIEF